MHSFALMMLMTNKAKSISIEEHERATNVLTDKIDYLQYQLEKALKALYGRKSEKQRYLDSEYQQGDFFEAEELPEVIAEEIEVVKEHKRRKPKKNRFPENAEREINDRELEKKERLCACCGLPKTFFDYDASEKAHYVPATMCIREDRRHKYICKNKECSNTEISIAPVAPTAFPKTTITDTTRAHFLVSKFVDHCPYFRQSKILEREGIHFADSSMVHYGMESADALVPIVTSMLNEITQSSYIQADETTIPVIRPRESKSGTHLGYLWGYAKPKGSMVFVYEHGRASQYPTQILESFKGILQTDRYSGYKQVQLRKEIIDLACWTHARRKFTEANKYAKKRTTPILKLIGQLYAIEKKARDENYSYSMREEIRQREAVPILHDLKRLFHEAKANTLPTNPLCEAASYALNHWDALNRYVLHGEAEIDNNLIENSMRPIALGRKNYMFAGSEGGAETAAIIYSITESCRRLGINPSRYLVDTFGKLAKLKGNSAEEYKELTPASYAARTQ